MLHVLCSFYQPSPKREEKSRRENLTRGIVDVTGRRLAARSNKKHLRFYKDQNSLRGFSCHWWLEIKYRIFGLNSTALSSGIYVINHAWKVLSTGILTKLNKMLLCTARCNFASVEEFTSDPIWLLFLTTAHLKCRPRILIFHGGVI